MSHASAYSAQYATSNYSGAGYGATGYGGAGYGGAGYGGAGYGGAGYGGAATNTNTFNDNSGYGAGGGGYMNQSQGGGGAAYMGASQTNENYRSNRIETVTPLTIKQINEASNDAKDDRFTVNGNNLDQITLVARIMKASVQMAAIVLLVDDCTASIELTYIMPVDDGSGSNEIAVQKRAWIKEGAWLRIVASLQTQNGVRGLSAYRIRKVTDFNELIYHRLDVVNSFLMQTREKPNASAVNTGTTQPNITSQVDVANDLNASMMNEGLIMNPLQRVIYEYVQSKQNVSTMGVTVDDVTRDVAHGATQRTVKEILDGFTSDGHMYTTLDENHYAFCKM